MISRRLYVVNESTLVSNSDVKRMVAAVNKQVRDHIAPAWGVARDVVEFHTGTLEAVQTAVPKDQYVFALLDDSDQAGALGWHWQDDKDRIYGEYFAKPALAAHSTALSGPYAISATLSHEAAEVSGDPNCNRWRDTGRGFVVAEELSDPVEADIYEIDGVAVSNFVLPEWFDPIVSSGERFDYLGRCKRPFSMTHGGYWVQAPIGAEQDRFNDLLTWERQVGFDVRGPLVFSSEMPQWRRQQKFLGGRNLIKRTILTGMAATM